MISENGEWLLSIRRFGVLAGIGEPDHYARTEEMDNSTSGSGCSRGWRSSSAGLGGA